MPDFNMQPKKHPMPVQEPSERNKNFKEVALGYDAQTAIDEAKRCLNCKNKPCVSGCPVGIDIPRFIAFTAAGDFESAYETITQSSSLPAVCGRVCPQETQCEGKCTRGIKAGCEAVGIGYLERFVADYHNARKNKNEPGALFSGRENKKKIAVIGSGPAGLSCAWFLAQMGYPVTVFEAMPLPGGMLRYGIPAYRLPDAIVAAHIARLEAMGIAFRCNTKIGEGADLSLSDLKMLTEEKIGRIGTLKCEIPLVEFTHSVIELLRCNGLRYVDAGRPVHRVAVGGGACGCYIPQAIAAGCDTFVTSDLKYNDFLDTEGLNLIDAGHFPTENVVCPALRDRLAEAFPAVDVLCSTSHSREIIQYCIKEK